MMEIEIRVNSGKYLKPENKILDPSGLRRICLVAGARLALPAAPLSWSRRLLTDATRRGASAEPASLQLHFLP